MANKWVGKFGKWEMRMRPTGGSFGNRVKFKMKDKETPSDAKVDVHKPENGDANEGLTSGNDIEFPIRSERRWYEGRITVEDQTGTDEIDAEVKEGDSRYWDLEDDFFQGSQQGDQGQYSKKIEEIKAKRPDGDGDWVATRPPTE